MQVDKQHLSIASLLPRIYHMQKRQFWLSYTVLKCFSWFNKVVQIVIVQKLGVSEHIYIVTVAEKGHPLQFTRYEIRKSAMEFRIGSPL